MSVILHCYLAYILLHLWHFAVFVAYIALTCAIDAIFYLESFFTNCEMVREYSVSVFEDFIYDGKAWVAPTQVKPEHRNALDR